MADNANLYDKSYECPICGNNFTSKKVKTSAMRPGIKDTDLYTPYKGDDPTWYTVVVCPECGYSNYDVIYGDITVAQKELYNKTMRARWRPRSFCDERVLTEVIEASMLALATFQVIGMKKSMVGKLCLRLAWLYRALEDPKEQTFMEFAVKSFEEAFTTERFEDDKENELTILYLSGELNRRLGNYSDASKWFSMVISDPEVKKWKHLENRTRDQMGVTREEFQKAKQNGLA